MTQENVGVEAATEILKEAAIVKSPEQIAQEAQFKLVQERHRMMQIVAQVQPSGRAAFMTEFDFVCQFHALMGTWANIKAVPTEEMVVRRIKIVDEEVNKELMPMLRELESGKISWSLEHRAQMLDHLVDCVYVLLGTAAELGLPFDMGFEIVHQANMMKFANGVVKNEYGKLVKPEGWIKPDATLFALITQIYKEATLTDSQEHQKEKTNIEETEHALKVAKAAN